MSVTRFWKRLSRRIVQPRENRLLRSLRSRSEIQTILAHQRALADRNGHEFSLVVFSQRQPQANGQELGRLADVVVRRCRSTDEVGWFEEGQIGVVLPCTPADGAWRFADGVCEIVAKTSTVPICTVYAYPSDRFPGEGGDKRQGRSSDVAPDSEVLSVVGSLGDADTQNSTLVETLVASAAQPKIAPSRAVEHMEALFSRPLPWWKRAMDVAGSMTALILFSPVMLITAIIIKLTSKGPVIFKQQRAGLGGKPFTFYKFRSMDVGAEHKKQELLAYNEQTGPVFKMANDPRVTAFGRYIRKWSVDELPQFWNVLKGDMTLVGPRPLPCHEQNAADAWHDRRLSVTPGITCLWQVSGRSGIGFDDWVRLDIEYSRTVSPLTDLRILFLTPIAVLSRHGAC